MGSSASDAKPRRAGITAAGACIVGLSLATIGSLGCAFEPTGVELQPSNGLVLETPVDLVDFENDRGESLVGVLLRPEALPPPAPMPAVVVLHGSGGLFTEPDRNDELLEVSSQFSDWAAILGEQGYVVLLPSSFYSRGYFDWDDHPHGVDETERLVMRTYDAYAALRFACEQPYVDCDRVGVVGFSNGASVTLMSMHEGLDEVQGMSELTPAVERERFARAVSFYPGCGLHDLVDDDYFPSTPTTIEHASKDSLVDECPALAWRVSATAEARAVETPLSLTIHDGADHGFDGDPRNAAETRARDEARASTLESFEGALMR